MKSNPFRTAPPPDRDFGERSSKKRVNWDKVVYLTLLVLVGLLLLRFTGYETLYARSEGRIVSDMLDVRLPADVEITGVLVQEGDTVEAGSPLFEYVTIDDIEASKPVDGETLRELSRQYEELRARLDIKRVMRKEERDLVEYYEQEAERVKKGIYSGLNVENDLRSISHKIKSAQGSLAVISEEIKILEHQIENLNRHLLTGRNPIEYAPKPALYSAPKRGVVVSNEATRGELLAARETILRLQLDDPDKLVTVALFAKGDLAHVPPGTRVTINHYNGLQSRGVVAQIRTPSHDMADVWSQAQDRRVPSFAATIYPEREEDRAIWAAHRNAGVTISARKY